MQMSIATVSIGGTFPEKLDAIVSAGFSGIEVFEQDLLVSDIGPRGARDMIADRGLQTVLFQPFRDFEGLPEPERTRAFRRARHKFDFMSELGASRILVCSSLHPRALGGIDRAAADLAELGQLAATYGIEIAYEALAWGRYVSDHRDAWEVVRRAGQPNVGLALDSFHTLVRGIPPDTIRSIPGDRIFFVQLADAPAINMDLLYLSRHFRVMPGEGDLDLAGFVAATLATGYKGPLSLEIFNDHLRADRPQATAVDAFRSLRAVIDAALRKDSSGSPSSVPAPPVVRGVTGLAVNGNSRPGSWLHEQLACLGFQELDRDTWSAGGLDVFIENGGGPDGVAIATLDLAVDDVAGVLARAAFLGDIDVGDDGVTSGLTAQTDAPELRFHPATDQMSRHSGSAFEVDHIGQTVPFSQLHGWALFYTSLLGGRKSQIQDVIDPNGVVRSLAVEAGGLRVTLNGTDSPATLAGTFQSAGRGSVLRAPVQHIAFRCANLFQTSARLERAGFRRLSIGANYYADLTTRFDLSSEFVADLAAANMMYDETEDGSFLQIYSQPGPEGFFLELVERLDGYDGYGAPNAPFRTAALKRARPQIQALTKGKSETP